LPQSSCACCRAASASQSSDTLFVSSLTAFYLTLAKRWHSARRTALGKTGDLVDASLENTKDAAAAQQANGAQFAANAFDDLTDRVNEDFICASLHLFTSTPS
jgi:Na+/alanine symporter